MGRVWILTGALVVVSIILYIFNSFVGIQGMLTIGLCIGAGASAAYVQGQPSLGRAMFLFGGVFVGALGFVLGALTFPDTATGLFLGAAVPQVIIGLITMWSKRLEYTIVMAIGAGALAGVYANDFDLDPQSLNISLPIALGQTILPMGLGFLAAVIVRSFIPDDPPRVPKGAEPEPASDETLSWETVDADTAQLNLEETR